MGPGTLYGSLDRMLQSRLVEETGTTDDDAGATTASPALAAKFWFAKQNACARSSAAAAAKVRSSASTHETTCPVVLVYERALVLYPPRFRSQYRDQSCKRFAMATTTGRPILCVFGSAHISIS